jgi:phosphatidylinositol glycan class F
MGKKKSSSTNATDVVNNKGSAAHDAKRGVKGDPDPLPLAQYLSLIGTHTLLLLFCMTLMPRSTLLFMDLPPQASSQDRPQAEWMAPITVLPSWSVGWMCIGAAAVQIFWARRLRTWVMADEGNSEAKLEEARRGMKVFYFTPVYLF